MKAEEFDRRFDAGEDMSEFFDLANARRPNQEKQKIKLNLPQSLFQHLKSEAEKEDISVPVYLERYLIEQWMKIA